MSLNLSRWIRIRGMTIRIQWIIPKWPQNSGFLIVNFLSQIWIWHDISYIRGSSEEVTGFYCVLLTEWSHHEAEFMIGSPFGFWAEIGVKQQQSVKNFPGGVDKNKPHMDIQWAKMWNLKMKIGNGKEQKMMGNIRDVTQKWGTSSMAETASSGREKNWGLCRNCHIYLLKK